MRRGYVAHLFYRLPLLLSGATVVTGYCCQGLLLPGAAATDVTQGLLMSGACCLGLPLVIVEWLNYISIRQHVPGLFAIQGNVLPEMLPYSPPSLLCV